jgi:hypothetical protein
MSLVKPKDCNQNWLDMKPINNGRLCMKCKNTVMDFSKTPWSKIEEIQSSNNNSICGMYSKSQLDNWGKNERSKSFSRSTFVTSVVMLCSVLSPSYLQAQKTVTEQVIDNEEKQKRKLAKKISRKLITGNVKFINNEGILEGMPFVNFVFLKANIHGSTDFDGNFRIDITGVKKIKQDVLRIKSIGFLTKKIQVSKKMLNNQPIEIVLEEDTHMVDGPNYFAIEKPTKKEKILRKFKTWFKRKN